jgi:hypothetical protein
MSEPARDLDEAIDGVLEKRKTACDLRSMAIRQPHFGNQSGTRVCRTNGDIALRDALC